MLLHLPIGANRRNQFAAQFVPVAGGDYAWFANARAEGLLVRAAERDKLIADHSRIIDRTELVTGVWYALAFALVLALMFASRGQLPDWVGPALFVVPLPWVLWQWHVADNLPRAVTQGRVAALPPRLPGEGAADRLRALPLSIPALMVMVGALLFARLWWDGRLAQDPVKLAIGLGVFVFGAALFRLRAR